MFVLGLAFAELTEEEKQQKKVNIFFHLNLIKTDN